MSKIKEMITTLFPATKNIDEVVEIIESQRYMLADCLDNHKSTY